MLQRRRVILLGCLLLAVSISIGAVLLIIQRPKQQQPSSAWQRPTSAPVPQTPSTSTPPPSPPAAELQAPVAEFATRITKKKFGTFITPQNSPVQPERFRGYHTGVDVEYQDVSAEVSVVAIADGVVVVARRVSGYGGVVIIRHPIRGQERVVLYGHLAPAELPEIGAKVTKGQKIGRLGQGYSTETDGERKHLHLAVRNDVSQDLRGYVQTQVELGQWLDPLSLPF